MEKIFRFFVVNWRFTFTLKVLVILAGLASLLNMNREAFPPVNFAAVNISTIYPGASPEEVEDKVTHLIEEELRGISGIKEVFSVSEPDRSNIDVRIDIDTKNTDKIVNEIQRAVQRAKGRLPAEITDDPLVFEVKADEIPIIEVALVAQKNSILTKTDQIELLNSKAVQFKKILEDIKGVASVKLSGKQEKEYQVYLDPKKLKALDVGLAEVSLALSTKIKNIPSGIISNDKAVEAVRVLSPVTDAESIENLVVRSTDISNSVKIGDVGYSKEGRKPAKILARLNGQSALLIVVAKKGEADAVDVVDEVKKGITNFEKNLPADLKLVIYNNEGQRVVDRLNIVTSNAGLGFIVVVLILFLFLPFKVGIFSSLSLPLCILGTVFLMVYQGANFNIITMMALIICLGNLVDNSVVISEHYARLREEGMNAQDAAVQSAVQFWIPFTASTLTIIAAFLPMLVTKGVMGQFIKWIPITVTAALLFSLFEALFLLPARLQFIDVQKTDINKKLTAMDKLENLFAKAVLFCVYNKWKTFVILLSLIISGFVATAAFNRFELFPADGIEFYIARYETKKQTAILKTDLAAEKLSLLIQKKLDPKNFESFVSRTGIQQVDVSDPQIKVGENVGFILITVKLGQAQYLNVNKVLTDLRTIEKPAELEKLSFENIAGGPPIGKPITLRIRSLNEKQIVDFTAILLAELNNKKGLFNIESDVQSPGQEITVRVDDKLAAQTGLSTDAVGSNLRSGLQGFVAGVLNRNNEEVEVVVRLDEQKINELNDIRKFEMVNSQGQLVPLEKIASFSKSEAPLFRKNYNFKRTVTITAEVDQNIITTHSANSQLKNFVELNQNKFQDLAITFGGEEESTNESLSSLGVALVISIIGIFGILVFVFQSFSKPFLILSSIPLGLIGVCYAFIVDQRPLSFIAFIGVVGLSGVVINSAIILIDYIEELRRKLSGTLPLEQILVRACKERLKPVLATGLTTVVGLLPAAWGFGGYDSLLVPITLALSWGMIVGSVLSLVWIPSTYLILESIKSKIFSA